MLSEYLLMNDMTDSQKLLFTQKFGEARKDRTTALLLTFFLGGIGGHKFYMGRIGMGFAYLLFCWTLIPSLAAFIELFLISGQVRDYNEKKAVETAMMVKAVTGKSPAAS